MSDDNKPIKYLRYAIGEIILVVVGILIALQINTWNEGRKLRAQEFVILSSIHSDLQNCREELAIGVKYSNKMAEQFKKVNQYMDNDLPYNTELDSVFSILSNWFSPYFSYSSYETLKIKGVNLIKNKDLREDLVVMYERTFPYITEDFDQYSWIYAQSVSMPLVNKHIEKNLVNGLAQPNDFEKLKENIEFKNMIKFLVHQHEMAERIYSFYHSSLDTLILDIEHELIILDN